MSRTLGLMRTFLLLCSAATSAMELRNYDYESRWPSGADPENLSKIEQIGRIHPALPKTKLLSADESYFELDIDARPGDEVIGRVNLANNSFEKAQFSIVGGTGQDLFVIEVYVNSRGKHFGVIRVAAQSLRASTYSLEVRADFEGGVFDTQLYTVHRVDEPLAERFLREKTAELLRNDRLSSTASDVEIGTMLEKLTPEGDFEDMPYDMGQRGWTNTCASGERLLKLATAYLDTTSRYHQDANLKQRLYAGILRNAEQNGKFRTDWADTHVWRNSDWIAGIGLRFYPRLREEMQGPDPAQSVAATQVYDAILDVCDVLWAERMFERPAIGNANRNHRMRSLITRAALSYDYNRALTDQDVWYDTVDPRIPGFYPNGALGDVMELIETSYIFTDTYGNRNGFFPDGTICHHPRVGIQFTADAYGWEWLVENSIPMARFLKNTRYRMHSATYDIIAESILDTYRPLTFNGYLDMAVGGLLPDRSKWGPRLRDAVAGLLEAKSDDTIIKREAALREYQAILERNGYVDELTLNQPFWNIDYLVHRRPNYFASAKMISQRSRGLERGIDRRSYYYLGDGALFLRVNADDYNGLHEVYNWHAIPGTTAEQRLDALPLGADSPFPGANGTNTYAGVVSDGRYGFGAFVYERNHADESVNYATVNAKKGFFFLEDEIVALGNSIQRVRPGDGQEIWTTLNQIAWEGDIVYCVDGKSRQFISANEASVQRRFDGLSEAAWVYHDRVGYVILPMGTPTDILLTAEIRGRDKRMFQLAINHGRHPSLAAYQYVLLPDVTIQETEAFAATLKTGQGLSILSNSDTLLAVHHPDLDITQAAFYEPGDISIPSSTGSPIILTVDRPALVQLARRKGQMVFAVTDPTHSRTDTTITIEVNRPLSGTHCAYDAEKGVSRLQFTHSAEEVLAGKPMVASFDLASPE